MKFWHTKNNFICVLLLATVMVASCSVNEVASTSETVATVSPVATQTYTATPKPTRTAIPSPTPSYTPTRVPLGMYVLFFYSPLIMSYDPVIWQDNSNYAEWGDKLNPVEGVMIKSGLQAKNAVSCLLGEQGPTDFNGPTTEVKLKVGNINYTVISLPGSSPDVVNRAYLAEESLATEYGLPVFWVSANSSEWDKCRSLAERVLATLRFP